MSNQEEILHLYTLKFPQGGHEAFIGPELPYLAKEFKTVRIFPWMQTGEAHRKLPSNVEVIYTGASSSEPILKAAALKLAVKELAKGSFRKELRYNLSNASHLLQRKAYMQRLLASGEAVIHYSYWFSEWATVLGMLSAAKVIEGYLARAHGFDLYDERHNLGYQPYRSVQLKGLIKIFPISKMGKSYLKERLDNAVIQCAYLGSEDHGLGPKPDSNVLQLFSLARIIPLKRVSRIVEVLKACKTAVHWTHVGDGSSRLEVERELKNLPSHITVDIRGERSHAQVMELMQNQAFHLLISLSESEGLPVSMMEAMSFGIPVLSTAVGGVSEIVNERSGILIDAQTDVQNIAELLDGFLGTELSSEESRQRIRQYWQEKFSAANNYPSFIEELKQFTES